ncbi:MAG: DUF2934 domain-containing protein [bacterium]
MPVKKNKIAQEKKVIRLKDDKGRFISKNKIAQEKKIISEQEFYEKVAQKSYQYFIEKNYSHGYDSEDWLRAENEIKKEYNLL